MVIATSARLAVSQGRLAEADRWIAELRDKHMSNATIRPMVELICARVWLAHGNVAGAKTLLEGLLPDISASGQMAYEIEMRMLLALASQQQGETPQALESLGQAIAQAMPEGYIRLFLDEGAPMLTLLKRLRDQRTTNAEVAGYCTKLLVMAGAETYSNLAETPVRPTPPELLEPLSVREMEVLGLLADGYSNQEIASQLVVALSTVKTHVHHLYAKLQTPDRLRAVTRARALGLLEADGYTAVRPGRLP
jgi:LuxR family maltose regulon positive regulatory protein